MVLTVKSVANKFTKNELMTTIIQMEPLIENACEWKNKLTRKNHLIESLVNYCEVKKITVEVAETLDLSYVKSKQETYEWKVYEFKDVFDKDNGTEFVDPEELHKKLLRYLNFGYEASCQKILDEAVWLRISAKNPFHNKSTIMYGAHYLHSRILIANFSIGNDKAAILKAIARSLNFCECREHSMTGRNIKSMMQLISDKDNPGYRMKHTLGHPLLLEQSKRRKSKENEAEPSRDQRETYLEEVFGTSCQPNLENLEYEIETTSRNKPRKESLKWKVSFKGPSVLEGMRELVSKGIADYPLPKHMENVRMMGANNIKLKSTLI